MIQKDIIVVGGGIAGLTAALSLVYKGNEVTVTKAGGGVLVCCGKPMEKIE